MCGVIGLVFGKHRDDLGQVAAELLKTLEYRGYDSTGAVIQGESPEHIQQAKDVGAPSDLVESLGITQMQGSVFCGQVRWATFGAVTKENSQPHIVKCKTFIYGAHNGNVTNCDELKQWLTDEGHDVVSDNDGEMVVHTIEHFFAIELQGLEDPNQYDARRLAMRTAVAKAHAHLKGSYAAVVVDPVTKVVWAIKQGSSLYFGYGQDEHQDNFAIASSDLSSVLKMTRIIVSLSEGEFVEFTDESYQVCAINTSHEESENSEPYTELSRKPVRSRLRAKDTALLPPYETFMEQEIHAQIHTLSSVIGVFQGGSEAVKVLRKPLGNVDPQALVHLRERLDTLLDQFEDEVIKTEFQALVDSDPFQTLLQSIPNDIKHEGTNAPLAKLAERLTSTEAGFLADLLAMGRNQDDLLAIRILDTLLEIEEVDEYEQAVVQFIELCDTCINSSGRIYVVCCGSSYNAAKAACLFFNDLSHTELIPILPGDFRGQYSQSLRDGDLFIAVSQSGETKDLIDVLNYIIQSKRAIKKIALVNNINSTLAQEKSDLYIPLRCGPEIAVPATKSFINQLMVFYCLALRLAQKRIPQLHLEVVQKEQMLANISQRFDKLSDMPLLISETIKTTDVKIEKAAELLYLAPSIHILATRITAVAKEGALKIREVVLNHTQGFEGAEFKHGPNTILGFNTLFGPMQVDALLKQVSSKINEVAQVVEAKSLEPQIVSHLAQAITDSIFSHTQKPFILNTQEQALYDATVDQEDFIAALTTDYPLIYITGPEDQDVHLTISQINTHKIRGASTVVVAEDNVALKQAASKAPMDNPHYTSVYIELPRTNDSLMSVFTSTIVLQLLALKMSLLKMNYLDRMGIADHGVHPDVPKNVSKSITVD